VTPGELLTALDIQLDTLSLFECWSADGPDLAKSVGPGELLDALDNQQNGCPDELAGASAPLTTATAELQIGAREEIRGGTVIIPVELATSPPNTAAALQFDILFSSAALAVPNPNVDCEIASRLGDHQIATSVPASPPPPSGSSRLRIVINPKFGGTSIEPIEDGTILYCLFQVSQTASPGAYSLTSDVYEVVDVDSAVMSSSVTSGSVEVTSLCEGCGCS
jgi:hypothetical protein